jgi:signal transduction histidine kinase
MTESSITSVESGAIALTGSKVFVDASKLHLLLNASRALASTNDVDQLLGIIVSEVRRAIACDGAGVALYDKERDDFYWRIIQDRDSLLASAKNRIRIPKGSGVGGWVFETGRPALVNDAAADARIYRPVETKSGFNTRNMICVPLKTVEKRLGVLYALNKIEGDFDEDDVEVLNALSGNIALALENASNYEALAHSYKELERLDRVKGKMLHHLSHELQTPLSIIEASLRIMERRIVEAGLDPKRFPLERLYRNLARLQMIERQVVHIVQEEDVPRSKLFLDALDYLKDLLEIQGEEEPRFRELTSRLRARIEGLLPSSGEVVASVDVPETFGGVQALVAAMARARKVDVVFSPPDPGRMRIPPQVLFSIIEGLVRNAIENTPDHGRVVVKGARREHDYVIRVIDFGVGIPESEQANIFEGFYPVREIDMYSSGSRYAFYAGGTGTDLLKMKIFSERYGFTISFKSARCPCVPTVSDQCPGDAARCPHCETAQDCLRRGGTEFIVEFPEELLEEAAIS